MRLQIAAFCSLIVAVAAQNGVVQCGGSWQQLGDKCFLAVAGSNRGWDAARIDCQNRPGADLAVIPDKATTTFLKVILSGVTTHYWIGLHDRPNENNFEWVDGESLADKNYTFWVPGEPNDGFFFSHDCAAIRPSDGRWYDYPCSNNRPYICERNSTSLPKCDESHGWRSYNGKCYQFFYDYQTWQTAQDTCSFYKDGHIAYVRSPEDQAFLDNLQVTHGYAYWIGLQDGSTNGEYQWTDQTKFDSANDFSNWKTGQPTNKWYGAAGDCGKVDSSGLWTISSCNSITYYVCEIPEGTCAPGWDLVNGNCYQVNSKTPRTWTDAKLYCEAQLAFLTIIKSDAENNLIKSYLTDLNSQGINELYIGASDLETDGTFAWVDGSKVANGYTHWVSGQPPLTPDQKKDCAYIDTADSLKGEWRAGDCFMLGAYICQTKAGNKVESVPSTPITDHCDGPGWDLHKDYCYEIVLSTEKWADAKSKCQAMGAELVSIHNDDEQSFMSARISSANERVWMGLNDQTTEGTFVWTDGTNFDYNNWADPSNIGSSDCVTMEGHTTSYGLWKTRSCSEGNYYACKKPSIKGTPAPSVPPTIIYDSRCGTGWELDKKSGKCFLFQPFENVNWFGARYACRLVGGDLMSLTGNDDSAYASGRLQTTGGGISWIGCNDLGREGGWVWSNKKPFSLLNWAPGQPDNWLGYSPIGEHCCNIDNNNGRWNDNFCENQMGYSCNKDDMIFKYFITYSEKRIIGPPTDSMTLKNVWPKDCAEKCRSLPTNSFYCKSFDYERATRTCYLYKVDKATAGGLIPTFDTQHFDFYERDVYVTPPPQPTPVPSTKNCPTGWGQYQEYCYYANFNKLDFAGAQAECQKMGAELTTIHNMNVNNFLRAFVYEQKQNENRFWIGLTDQKQEMLYEWANGEPVVFTNWNAKEPNDANGEDCTELYIDSGFWNDVPCKGYTYNSLCRKAIPVGNAPPPDTTCPTTGGWDYYWNDRCYQIDQAKMSWTDAVIGCATTPGAQLVVIEDRMELAYLSGLMGLQDSNEDFFIAFSDSKVPGFYEWTDGSQITYTNWGDGQPDDQQGHCVAMNSGDTAGYWADRSCTDKYRFICEVARAGYPTIPPIVPVTPTSPSDTGCANGWVGWGSRCFLIFEMANDADAANWDTANSECDKMGASLASFHHPDEETYLISKFSPTTSRRFWIGLNDQRYEGGYSWSDGTPVEYTNWATGEPNDYGGWEECVETDFKGGKWNDQSCWDRRNYICAIDKGKPVITDPPPTIPTGADCPGFPGWKHLNPYCYYFSTSQDGLKDWHDAEEFCHTKNAHLVSIHDSAERKFVNDRFEPLVGNYWCGLRANITHPGIHEWSDGTLLDLKNWQLFQPDTKNGEELCVQMRGSLFIPIGTGAWLDANCGLTARFVCKKNVDGTAPTHTPTTPPTGGCPSGWLKYQNRCYKIMGKGGASDPRKNWKDAKVECQKTTGANLASIHSTEVQTYLTADMIEANDDVWIGLSALASGNKFVWTDSSSVDFVNWAPNQNDQTDFYQPGNRSDCIRMMYNDDLAGKWLDENCDDVHAYVCMMKPDDNYSDNLSSTNCTALSGYTQHGDVCFKIYTDTRRKFDEAKAKCEADGSNLASIMNGFEQAKLQSMMDDKEKSGNIWIGLYDDPNTGVFAWLDGWPLHYDNWGWTDPKGNPYVIMREDGFLYEKGEWSNVNSGVLNRYWTACKYNPSTPPPPEPTVVGTCDPGWGAFGSSCYIVGSGIFATGSFGDAVYDCDKNYGGSQVVTIGSKAENSYVKNLAQKEFGINEVFIGIERSNIGGWEWIDGSPLTYVNWGEDPDSSQNKDCAEMLFDSNAQWYLINCKSNSHYVCEKPKTVTVTTEPPKVFKNCSTGETDWKELDSYCYYVSSEYKTWHDAEAWCNQNGGYLTSIHSDKENQFILDLFPWTYQSAWIGYHKLYDGNDADTYRWTDGSNPLNYTHWVPGQPDDQFGAQKCANMLWQGTWEDNNCGATEGFACKKKSDSTAPITKPPPPPQVGNCPAGWSKIETGCYQIKGEAENFRTWEDARVECQKQPNGDLASIHDQGVQSLLTSLIKSHNGNMWIGLRGGTGGWWGYHWVDQSNVDYEHWATGQPSFYFDQTKCVLMINDADYPGRWDDQQCSGKHGYLCYQPLDPTLPTQTPPVGDCELDNYEQYYDDCFTLNSTYIPFVDAMKSCASDGGYLATLVDGFDEAYLIKMLYDLNLYAAWIGFAASNSTGTFVWLDQRPDTYINWGPYQPSGPGNCVILTSDAYWMNVPCQDSYPFFCRINDQPFVPPTWPPDIPGRCPDNWVPYGNNCYLFESGGEYANWYESYVKCQMDYDGAQLLSIHSKAENTFIEKNIENAYSWQGVWLDLTRNKTASNQWEFYWNDGQPLDYDNWRHDEPSQGEFYDKDCAAIMPGAYGKWETDGCNYGNGFVCQKPKEPLPEGGCEEGWFRMNNWCYGAFGMFEGQSKTWPAAEKDCNSKGGNLATVYGQSVQSLLEGMMIEMKQTFAWIGLSKRLTGFFEWVDGTPFHYKNWAEGNPDQLNDDYKCVRLTQDDTYPGLWSNIPCGSEDGSGKASTAGYICQKPTDPNIPVSPTGDKCNDNGYYRFDQKCYKAYQGQDQMKTFQQAQDQCVADGGSLPSVPNGFVEGFMETLLFYYDIKDAWIGLKQDAQGAFVWVNSDTHAYRNWEKEPGQGTTNTCVRIKNRQVWEPVACDTNHNFICQLAGTAPPPKTTAGTAPPPKTTAGTAPPPKTTAAVGTRPTAVSVAQTTPSYQTVSVAQTTPSYQTVALTTPRNETEPTGSPYKGLGGGAIAGIVIGVLVAVILVIGLVYFLLMRRQSGLKAPEIGLGTVSGFDNAVYSPSNDDVTFDAQKAGATDA